MLVRPALYTPADVVGHRISRLMTERDVAAIVLSCPGVEWVLIEVPEVMRVRLTIRGGDAEDVRECFEPWRLVTMLVDVAEA